MAVNQQILAQTVIKSLQAVEEQMDAESSALDSQIRSMEMDFDTLREKRREYLKHLASKKQEYLSLGHGSYQVVTSTQEFFNLCKKSEKLLVHFYRPITKRCEIIDKHLQILCTNHLETRFLKET